MSAHIPVLDISTEFRRIVAENGTQCRLSDREQEETWGHGGHWEKWGRVVMGLPWTG